MTLISISWFKYNITNQTNTHPYALSLGVA